mmetsp:Transcript_31682/g.88793  ORF Transcript_31682/g.88793 Transcript_31682/m.88793 type:complete len:154 (+) Transcript_31682:85-546(+)|eukprot:CAMPEP_0119120922 /NCGR_PEP_ID=MMETSP1310-20130426/1767_1 /TAXON_ID=464262 /ORGANISM="Genus nov. species nov., Strain RCC2339" /LENGTH=153 /DNA_ID=CAMNT_0007110439 /DNA_START=85 /DNA_END=546 /DNA_ORIENTATION=+
MPFGAPKCPRCGKSVYFAERQNVLGKDWHKMCVKCKDCNKKLEPGSYSDMNGEIFCKTCHAKASGISGYGFGGAGGSLASYESHGKGESELIGGDPAIEPSGGGSFPSQSSGAPPAAAAVASSGGTTPNFCPDCGGKTEPDSRFCSECGKKFF